MRHCGSGPRARGRQDRAAGGGHRPGRRVPLGRVRGTGQGRLPRGPRAGGVRRSGRRRAGGRAGDRGGRPRLRDVLAHTRGEQARHDAAAARGVGGGEAASTCRRSRAARRCSPTRCPSPRRAPMPPRCAPAQSATEGGYVLNGVKRWITNAGVSKFYTVMAVTDPDKGANGISAFVVEDGDPGFSFGAPEHKLGIKGSPTRELYFDNCDDPGRPAHRRARGGLQDRAADPGPHPRHHRRAGARHRPGRARLRDRLREGAQAVRQGDRRLPGHPVHARRHGDEDRGGKAAHLRRGGHGRSARCRARRCPT